MDVFKIHVNDREYSSYNIYKNEHFESINLEIDPIKNKLFSDDVFSIDNINNIKIIHSTIRSGTPMPGVLIINNNKTYGRQQKTNKKSIAKPKGPSTYLVIPITKKLKIKTVLSGIVG